MGGPSGPKLSRRGLVAGTASVATAMATGNAGAQMAQRRNPILGYAIATIGVPDVVAAQAMYEKAIGLEEIRTGTVSEQVASTWGAPAMQGRLWAMMQCESGDPSFRIRIVEVDPVPGYRAMGHQILPAVVCSTVPLWEWIWVTSSSSKSEWLQMPWVTIAIRRSSSARREGDGQVARWSWMPTR